MNTLETGRETIEKNELTTKEKKQLGEVWAEVILGTGNLPEDIEDMSNAEIKDWLSFSLLSEIDNLCHQWEIIPDEELIETTKAEADPEEQSKRQLAYIKECFRLVNDFIEENKEDNKVSGHWNSWPKTMKEGKSFNCVGATMVGMNLLNKAGIKNYYGNPAGHVINIVELSDGGWVYADFRNDIMKGIEPKISEISGATTIEIDDDEIDYGIIHLIEDEDLADPVLGNLSSLQKDAGDANSSDYNLWKQEAKDIAEENAKILEHVNIHDIHELLFYDAKSIHGSPEMREEEERVKLRWDFEDEAKKLTTDMVNKIGREKSLKLMVDNVDKIEAYLTESEGLSDLPEPIRDTFEKIKILLEGLESKDEKIAEKMRNGVLRRIRKSKK